MKKRLGQAGEAHRVVMRSDTFVSGVGDANGVPTRRAAPWTKRPRSPAAIPFAATIASSAV